MDLVHHQHKSGLVGHSGHDGHFLIVRDLHQDRTSGQDGHPPIGDVRCPVSVRTGLLETARRA
jgi:hypothetical protein